MRRFAVGLTIGMSVLLSVILLIARRAPEPAPPLPEKPTVYRLRHQERVFMRQSDGPAEESWVILPFLRDAGTHHVGVPADVRGFLSAEACRECHSELYETFIETAHYRTSSLPSRESIAASFEPGSNRLDTRSPLLFFEMVEREDGFYQDLHIGSGADEEVFSEQIDIVFGSGNHGQSYLYWKEDHLYQHHVSYYQNVGRWTNSPGEGFKDGTADLARPIVPRCVECHSTYFSAAPQSINRYDPNQFLLHVSCVRCHGAATEHVTFHSEGSVSEEQDSIVNPAELSAARVNELCALCHSAGASIQPAFTYRPGESLAEYIELDLSGESPQNDDPHAANQFARLMQSQCFQQSGGLTCVMCHDPHRHERGETELFSQRCHQCHEPAACGERARSGAAIDGRCIQCHMPSRIDTRTAAESDGGPLMPRLRDHFIGIWPDTTDAIRALLERDADTAP